MVGDQKPQPSEEWTMSVPEAGRTFFGLNRAASYRAARQGLLPVIRVGHRRVRACIPAIKRRLAEGGPA
jgi:hypothetical protein